METALYYDDIYLVPNYSELRSRKEADTTVVFGNSRFELPIIPSNMMSVINEEWASWLCDNHYFYVMHRFNGCTIPFVRKANQENWDTISISTGVNEDSLFELQVLANDKCLVDYITDRKSVV